MQIEIEHLKDVFPRRCDATGKGMFVGWYFSGVYLSDTNPYDKEDKCPQHVIDYVKNKWGETMEEFWEDVYSNHLDDNYYWTEWLELADCEGESYLKDGTHITEIEKGLYTDREGNIYKMIT